MIKQIIYKVLDQRIRDLLPKAYATPGAAAMDLFACTHNPVTLQPGDSELISSGIAIYIEDEGYAGMIIPRSGLGHKHGLVLGNNVGLIDPDYQGPILVSCWNRNRGVVGKSYTINPLDRIAQLIILPIAKPKFVEVDLFPQNERAEGGFGSTGVA